MTAQACVEVVVLGTSYALLALGFSVIYRTVRVFDVSYGATYLVGAYAGYCVATTCNCYITRIAIASGTACLFGLATDSIVYLFLRQKRSPALVLLIASFGVLTIVQNALQMLFGAGVRVTRTGPDTHAIELLGAVVTRPQVAIIAASILSFIAVLILDRTTLLGKRMRAVADDSLAADLVGISPQGTILAAVAIGSTLAGLAGFLISQETNLAPSMGLRAALKAITAAIVGGLASLPSAWLGGLLLGLIEILALTLLPAAWQDVVSFSVLLLVLLTRPTGLLRSQPVAN
jgi:branched-chain amino acid transport system permease protein